MHKTTFQLEAEIAALTAERAKLMQDVDAALNLQDHAQRAEVAALARVTELEAQLAARATPAQTAVEKMLEINQLDELGHEVARLQRALCFWLPSVTDREDEVSDRILQDAFLLCGIDGNIPDDFKTAQELGWVTLAPSPESSPSPSSVGAAIPEGWKLVPIEPTDAMLHDGKLCAAFDAFDHPDTGMEIEVVNMADIWRDMLTAAPLAEQVQGQQVPEGWRKRLEDMREASYTLSQYPELAHAIYDGVIDALDELEADGQKSGAHHGN